MQPKPVTVEDVIAALQHVRAHIKMYVAPADVPNVRNFLNGFELGLQVCGMHFNRKAWWQVQKDRGWEKRAVGPTPQMKEKGMTQQQIIDELIDIEIETLRRSACS